MFRKTTLAAFAALLLAAGPARAAAPVVITYGGFLLDSAGNPVTTASQLTFRFYAAASGGTALGQEQVSVVPSSEGFFSAVIGSGYVPAGGAPAFSDLFDAPVFMSVQFGSEAEMNPRIAITSVPSALSVDWTNVTGRPVSSCSGATPFVTGVDASGLVTCGATPTGLSNVVTSVGGTAPVAVSSGATPQVTLTPCPTGQILKSNGAGWDCVNDANSGGTITGVTAGVGLLGGGTSGTVTLNVNPATVQARVSGTCAPGSSIRAIAADGTTVTCQTDTNSGGTVTAVGVIAPLVTTGGNAPTISVSPCGQGEVLKFDVATGWNCAVDQNSGGTITGVYPGAGLVGGGPSGDVTLAPSFTAAGGDAGSATTVARGDHVHDARYYTQAQLNTNTAGGINAASNPVDWTKLKSVPTAVAYGGPRFANSTIGLTTPILTSCTNYGSVTISVPGPGTIAIEATSQVYLNHTVGTADDLRTFIGVTATDCNDWYGHSPAYIPASVATLANVPMTVVPRRALAVSAAGTYTYYLNGAMSLGQDASDVFYWARIFATYYPN